MTLITSPEDWKRYLNDLDEGTDNGQRPYRHAHYGEPSGYPCLVLSRWWNDDNGLYSYDHFFTYVESAFELIDAHKRGPTPMGETTIFLVKVLENTDLRPLRGSLARGEIYECISKDGYAILEKLNASERFNLSTEHFERLRQEKRVSLCKLTEV